MMKLCPIRYGGFVEVACQSGNLWVTCDTTDGRVYVGNYDGSSWTDLGVIGMGTPLIQPVPAIRIGDNLYSKSAFDLYYAPVTDLASDSIITASGAAQSPSLFSDGTYLYTPRDVTNGLNRLTLPNGAWSNPVVSGDADCMALTKIGSTLYGVTQNSQSLRQSSDNGETWTNTASTGRNLNGGIATDGSALLVAYTDGGDSLFKVIRSADLGDTWTQVYVSPSASQLLAYFEISYSDGVFFVMSSDGLCAYSNDGISWTAGATIPNGFAGTVARGVGCIVVGSKNRRHYISTNHGASWSVFGAPVTDSASDSLYLRTHWIGNDLPIC